ncbi:MAG: helix-turn-helix domain-containing protein [Planctomycetota bacterium]|jgi:transcriptional regulator with XRE-family HTH domain
MTKAITKFRQWRQLHGLSLQEVGDLTGMSESMISRLERGERRLNINEKVLVSRRLNTRIRNLFEVEDADDKRRNIRVPNPKPSKS